jgi:hypothetical protein
MATVALSGIITPTNVVTATSTNTLTNKTLTGAVMNGTLGATTPSTGAFTTLNATGVTTLQAGTVALPALTTSGDTNTGIFFPGSDIIAFSDGGVERLRINASGFLKASNTGTYAGSTGSYHELRTDNNAQALYVTSSLATTFTDALVQLAFTAQTPNSSSSWFLFCSDSTNQKAAILTTGTFESRTNTYGGVSDIKLKQDVIDAASQWDDLKAVRVRKFRFKDEPEGILQLGVIAQELETVSAGLVYETPDTEQVEVTNEDGTIETKRQETGTTTKSVKYSILYMKAVKALQEAMERIEQLEARLDAANL